MSNGIKATLAALLAAVGVYFQELLTPVIVVSVVMLCDYASGVAAAWVKDELSSRVGIIGIVKKVAYTLIIVVGIVVDWVVQEIVVRVKDGTAASVVAVLDYLERKYQDLFPAMFRTITVDNGSEFADVDGLERSCRGSGKRTTVYYCHPYRSSERGSNENQNRMLRRRFPKGTDFRKVGDGEVEVATGWLNRYPREMFGYASSEELFQEELCKLA